jgi:hypothetical protein
MRSPSVKLQPVRPTARFRPEVDGRECRLSGDDADVRSIRARRSVRPPPEYRAGGSKVVKVPFEARTWVV